MGKQFSENWYSGKWTFRGKNVRKTDFEKLVFRKMDIRENFLGEMDFGGFDLGFGAVTRYLKTAGEYLLKCLRVAH